MKKVIVPILITFCAYSAEIDAQVGLNTANPAVTLDVTAKAPTGNSKTSEGLLIPRVDRERAQNMTGVPTSTLVYIYSVTTGTQTGTTANVDAAGYYYYNGTIWAKLNSPAAAGVNLYNTDGTLTGNRTVTQADKTLAFTGTAANAFSVDGATFSVNAASDKVGIGTTTPGQTLSVSDPSSNDIASTSILTPNLGVGKVNYVKIGKALSFNDTSDISFNNMGAGSAENFLQIGFHGNGSVKTVFKANGNVGIGTVTPQKTMHVNGNLQVTNELNLGGNAGAAGNAGTSGQVLASQGPGIAPVWKNTEDISTNIYTNNGTLGGNRTVTQADKTLAFTGTATNAFSVDGTTLSVDAANNRVGIGTNTPQSPLTVEDAETKNSSHIAFFSRPNTPVGGTSGIQIGKSFAEQRGTVRLGYYYDGNNSTDNRFNITFHGLGPVFTIKGDGKVGIGTPNPSQMLHVLGNILASGSITPSDIRIKKEIADNTYGLKEISKLRTITYKYKDELLSRDKKIGFIAQEVKASMPELVTTANDDMKTLGVNYAEMTVVLTKAVQELQEIVKKQEEANQKQQEEINLLKSKIK